MNSTLIQLKNFFIQNIKWFRRQLYFHMRFGLKQRNFKPYYINKTIDQISFSFLIGDIIGEQWYKSMDSLSPELKFIKEHLVEKNDIIFECGAHHGFTTILASNWIGEKGKIVSFEAAPKNSNILKSNVEKNNLNNVLIKNEAIGSKKGTIKIGDTSNSSVVSDSQFLGTLTVPLIDLDTYSSMQPTLILLDIEGYEIEALKGATEILKNLPKFAIEVHTEMIRNNNTIADDIFAYLNKNNYNFWIQVDGTKEPRPYHNEILTSLQSPQVHLYAIPKNKKLYP